MQRVKMRRRDMMTLLFCAVGFLILGSVTAQNGTNSGNDTDYSTGNDTDSRNATDTTKTTTTLPTTTAEPREGLFPFGYSQGDWGLSGDDRLAYHYISQGFPTDSTRQFFLYISTNGYIVFGRYYNSFYPRKFPYRNLYIVAPYWTDSTTYTPGYYYYYWYYWYYWYTSARVYYQVYTNGQKRYGGDATDIFDRVNQLISNKKNVKQFQARWILIVTWYKMYIYGRSQTSTYQCILATDYQRSFTLYKYEDGGLMWPKTSYSFTPGVGFQMGNRKFYNSPYSRRREAYRIDTIRGNTGQLGLWIFQLDDNRAGVTPALKCLNWYANQGASDVEYMRDLDNRLSDCPCTIWQAFFDPRFRWAWRENDWYSGNYCFFVRLSPRWRTGSRKCCYRLRRIWWRFWWGYSWRYTYPLNLDMVTGGGLTRYNPMSFRQYRRYVKGDKEAHLNCCILSGYCSLYREHRKLTTCSRYRPQRRARFWGDPHITTLDGKGYTFNGWGEYYLLKVTNSTTNELLWTLQGRTERARNEAGEMTDATIFSAFAAKDYETNATMQAILNGNKTDMNVFCNNVDYTGQFQNRSADFSIDDDNLGCSRPENMTLSVTHLSGISLNVSKGIELLEISVAIPEEMSSTVETRGLMGTFNNDQNDDFTFPNGSTISINSTENEIFPWGQTWLISDAESVFSYRWGKNASSYRHEYFTPKFLSDYPETLVNEARTACSGNAECMFDYLSTNNSEIALSTGSTSNETQQAAAIMGNNIPTITVDRTTVEATVGQPTTVQITASDADNEQVTVSPAENITGAYNINQTENNAVFMWTPDSLDSVVIGLGASDPNGGETPTQIIQVLLCSGCSGHGQCNFNDTGVSFADTSSNSTTFSRVSCDCDDGWLGDDCDQDYDGCADDPCPTGTNCTDLTADQQQALNGTAYNCSECPAGREKIQTKCVDIDECNATESVCDQLCFNTDGSYQCACEDGYHLEGISNCVDNDECQRRVDNCSHICINVPGSYNCSCQESYVTSDEGRTCTVDPNNDPCAGTGLTCAEGCRTGANGPECFCRSGYAVSGADCVDIDECELQLCQQSCTNSDGGFSCNCLAGYKQLSDKISCEKCDPFHFGPNCDSECACTENGECHHTRGCVCAEGWTGADCDTDVDECATTQCGIWEACNNLPGTYECVCMDGYANVSGQCSDIDECTDDSHNCTYTCVNVQGTFVCECSAGYTGDGITCNDVDECANTVTDCQQVCKNTPGSYNCDCLPGFELNDDRITCTDKDMLCGSNQGGCNQICSINETTSAIQCFCRPGYELAAGNSTHCVDIDECANSVCSQTCVNTEGNFACTCYLGYSIGNDGTTCKACDEYHWGVSCTNDCNCGPGSPCNNTVGCICAAGWTGQTCLTDILECQTPNICDAGSECTELQGSYRCDCLAGTERVNGTCVDIDECSRGTHDCAQTCVNLNGTYACLCTSGFRSPQADGKICNDVNECTDGHLCEALCTNTEGGYTCSCYAEFNLNSDKQTCTRSNATVRCGMEQLECSYACNNDTGECLCANGYALQTDRFSCRRERLWVTARIALDLTFTADLLKPHTDAYKAMVHNIQEALRPIYQNIPNFKSILVVSLINGSVVAQHNVLFTQTASLTATQGVTTALLTLYNSGSGLSVGGVSVTISSVPVLITSSNTTIAVNLPLTCSAEPCAFNEVCYDKTGTVQCFPEGTTFSEEQQRAHELNRLAIGLGVGIPLFVILVAIIVIIVVKPWEKKGSGDVSGEGASAAGNNGTERTGSNSRLLGRRGSRVSPTDNY